MRTSLKTSNIGIFILAYSRLDHLKSTIDSLDKKLGKKDKIYIFCDNYSEDQKIHIKENVQKVIFFLKKLKKKRFIVFFRKKRMGLRINWHLAWSYMFNKFDKVICLEDDIIIDKNFLPFMKFYLNYYKSNQKVMNISGYSTKLELPKNYQYDCFFTKRSMSWGQGSWRRVWSKFKKMRQDHKLIIEKQEYKKKLIQCGGEDLLRAIILDYLKIIESIQIWWIWNIIRNDGFCINPSGSLVKNIGFDGSGYHTKKGDVFPKNKKIKNKKKLKKILFDEDINKNFLRNFKIKKITYLIFNFLPINLIYLIYHVKKKLIKLNFLLAK